MMETLTEFDAWTADLSGGMLLQLHYEEATQDDIWTFPVLDHVVMNMTSERLCVIAMSLSSEVNVICL